MDETRVSQTNIFFIGLRVGWNDRFLKAILSHGML
jgi:hypothetical protein